MFLWQLLIDWCGSFVLFCFLLFWGQFLELQNCFISKSRAHPSKAVPNVCVRKLQLSFFFSWCTQFCKMIMLMLLWEIKSFYYDDGKGHKANFPGWCMGTWADLHLQTKQRYLATGARCRLYLSLQIKPRSVQLYVLTLLIHTRDWGGGLISDSFPIGKSPWLMNKHMNCTC